MDKKATILIVERERILVDLLIRTLTSPELLVVGATSAEEGSRLFDLHAPDLVVIDPSVHNGLPLLVSIHSGNSAKEKTRVIVVSGAAEILTKAADLGINTVVDRDAGFDALVNAIRTQLPSDLKVLDSDNRLHVLVCDDEEELRNLISEFLKEQGYAVTVAKNGREAVEQVKNHPDFKIVLLDVSMPVMGGIEALNQIMAQDLHPSVIMMTAVADREIARQAIKNGAFDYILKPFDFTAIESSIAACLSRSEYQKQSWWKRLTRG
jgi:DNA-binding NtrC family response regulator